MDTVCEECAKRKRDAAERAKKRKATADAAKRDPNHQAGVKATKLARELPKKLSDMKRLHADFADDGTIQKVVLDAMTVVHGESGALLKDQRLETAAADLEAFHGAVERGEVALAEDDESCLDRIAGCVKKLKKKQ